MIRRCRPLMCKVIINYAILCFLVTTVVPAAVYGAPLVAITRPTEGAIVSGVIWIDVAFRSDSNLPITRLEIYINDQLQQAVDLTNPVLEGRQSFSWDFSFFPSTAHKIGARVIDTGGNVGTAVVNVQVQSAVTEGPDQIPPVVRIYYPAQGARLRGTVEIKAEATDNVGVEQVYFYIDGKLHKMFFKSPPYVAQWDTTKSADGPHVLEAVALDAAENEARSAQVTVFVENHDMTRMMTTGAEQPVTATGAPALQGPSTTAGIASAPAAETVTPPVQTVVPSVVAPAASPAAPQPQTTAVPRVTMPAPQIVTPAPSTAPVEAIATPVETTVTGPVPVRPDVPVEIARPAAPSPVTETTAPLLQAPSASPAAVPAAAATRQPAAPKTSASGLQPLSPAAAPRTTTAAAPAAMPVETPAAPAPVATTRPGIAPPVAATPAAPIRPDAVVAEPALPSPGLTQVRTTLPGRVDQPSTTVKSTPATGMAGATLARIDTKRTAALPAQQQSATLQQRVTPVPATVAATRPEVPILSAVTAIAPVELATAAVDARTNRTTTPERLALSAALPATGIATLTRVAFAEYRGTPVASSRMLARLPETRESLAPAGDRTTLPGELTAAVPVALAKVQGIKILFDGEVLSLRTAPEMHMGISTAPLREIFERTDGVLYWYPVEKEVRAVNKDVDMHLRIGDKSVQVNGESKTLVVAPYIKQGRTMVPLEFIADSLGVSITYDSDSGHILISSNQR